MSEDLMTLIVTAVVVIIPLILYLLKMRSREKKAREAAEKGSIFSEGPRAQHPHIDTSSCIGCQTCTSVCPEGDVLAMVGGKAAIVNGYKCIGHSLCFDACPVGAITMVMASPSMAATLPYLTPEYETNLKNLFIIGELGGLALIKNAVNQGRDCIDTITQRLQLAEPGPVDPDLLDVLIIGAGPGGLSASMRAIENKLTYLTIDREEVGGTVAKYPRQKLVMTSPVEFPLYGKFRKTELSKENLIAFWNEILARVDFNVHTNELVEDILSTKSGHYITMTNQGEYRSKSVILAMGRAGTPQKIGAKGEELPKVMYRLIEADHYFNKNIVVVGGGDSAIEAAMGLANQPGNKVTLSYRKDMFSRIKDRNAKRIDEYARSGKLTVLFNSNLVEVTETSAVIDVKGERQELPNDFVWIFAGGVPPDDFLKKVGVQFGALDITAEASKEAKEVIATKKQSVSA